VAGHKNDIKNSDDTMKLRLEITGVLALGMLAANFAVAAPPSASQQISEADATALTLEDLSKRVGQGDAAAQAALGQMYYRGEGIPRNYAKALQWLQRAAVQRHAGAQLALALMYARGHGVRKDPATAFVWAKKAAENGDATAQRVVGNMYDTGNGVRRDPVRAFRWYQKAAAAGDVDAQYNLGTMYYSGEGGREDKVLACAWFNLVAGRETDPKRTEVDPRDNVEQALTAAEVAEAHRIASAWVPGKPLVRERSEAAFSQARYIQPVLLLDYELRGR
jgi:TPR repeat protein